jgi:hypothetical protein
MSQVLKTESKI